MKTSALLLFAFLLDPAQALAQTTLFLSLGAKDQAVNGPIVEARAAELGANVVIDNAAGDADAQIAAVSAALESKVDAVVIITGQPKVATAVAELCDEAKVPLIFLNAMPDLPKMNLITSVVTSNDLVAGRLQIRYAAKLLGGKGEIALIQGEAKHPAAIGRTAGVRETLAEFPELGISVQGHADWSRDKARTLVAGWLKEGHRFGAILANNDEMALGAVEALAAAGVDPGDVVVAGVDATSAALDAMEQGSMAFTILQNGAAQAHRSVDNALALAAGKPTQQFDWVPYELVTRNNMASYR